MMDRGNLVHTKGGVGIFDRAKGNSPPLPLIPPLFLVVVGGIFPIHLGKELDITSFLMILERTLPEDTFMIVGDVLSCLLNAKPNNLGQFYFYINI
jgi:hypothetical protein